MKLNILFPFSHSFSLVLWRHPQVTWQVYTALCSLLLVTLFLPNSYTVTLIGIYMTLVIYEMLRKTRQGNTTQQKDKATQHNLPRAVTFQRKISCLGWDSNPQHSHSRHHLQTHTHTPTSCRGYVYTYIDIIDCVEYFSAGLGVGIKIFIINNIYRKYPKVYCCTI